MSTEHTLIANTGIHTLTFPLQIDKQDKHKLWYHEWYDTDNGKWLLEPIYELRTEDGTYYYNKQKLSKAGYLADPTIEISTDDLKDDGIMPLRIDDENCEGTKGEIFSMTFSDRDNKLEKFENVWLPIPYFFKQTEKKFKFGSLNWARMKLVTNGTENSCKKYNIILAFDTRTGKENNGYDECPVFPDQFRNEMNFSLCSNEFQVMDYCTQGKNWSYIDEYLLHLVHPNVQRVSQLKGTNIRKTAYIASYTFLVNYLATHGQMPLVKLYRDKDVETKDVHMVVDIGNSRTTALLIEDNHNFNQVRKLELTDYTNELTKQGQVYAINKHSDPFDMRLVFRKVDFGNFGIKDSRQFVYPSLVRLGEEANTLIHLAANKSHDTEELTTYSSPKRYLWDWHPSKEEWRYLTLEGEEGSDILNLCGISNQLKADGEIDTEGRSGTSFHYSRRSLMTLAFLEMLVQARTQINSEEHRSTKNGLGKTQIPRKIKKIIVTCPTAMSEVERGELVKCAKNAVILLENFDNENTSGNKQVGNSVEVIPASRGKNDKETKWYYDEATCSQLVYMYGEVGHKYKGFSSEFFSLYGKKEKKEDLPTITIGSVDIGAGTTDLMIARYSLRDGDMTTITPDPLFYDSYYYAGDDMLYSLIKSTMLLNENSAFRKALEELPFEKYRQRIKDFFGNDYNMQTAADRQLRKDFNLQYSIPLMCHLLELLKNDSKDCLVKYNEVFGNNEPCNSVIEGFRSKTGIDVKTLQWNFRKDAVAEIVRKEFEPLLKKIATIAHSYACDIVLLSGRPSSLPPIREIFLKYYPAAPNRLIVLNNYYVGDWYPFCENTGYIKDAKTIVAMGGVIAHYASEGTSTNNLVLNLEKLDANLKSTVNYIEAAGDGKQGSCFVTPTNNTGEICISSIPTMLNVKQIGMATYPGRPLYTIDFNTQKIADRIRRKAVLAGEDYPTDAKVKGLVNEAVEALKKRAPFKLTIGRDTECKEKLAIGSITDKNGDELTDSNMEINIQSMGIAGSYWLDNGGFSF